MRLLVNFDGGDEATFGWHGSSSDESFESRWGFGVNDKDKDFDRRILSSIVDVWASFVADDSVPRRTYYKKQKEIYSKT